MNEKTKIKLEFTPRQLKAFKEILDTHHSCFEENETEMKNLKIVDKMLIKNGHKRYFKMLV